MFTNPEQFAAATKTLFDLQVQTFNALASKTMQGVEQVVALNMTTAKNSMDGAIAASKELGQARDPNQAMAALSSQVQPGMKGAADYSAQIKQIIDDMRADFEKAADAHTIEARNTLSALIYDVTQNVKPGSENAVEVIKAAIDNAFKGYEQVNEATRKAVKTVEEQFEKAASLVNPGMGKGGNTE